MSAKDSLSGRSLRVQRDYSCVHQLQGSEAFGFTPRDEALTILISFWQSDPGASGAASTLDPRRTPPAPDGQDSPAENRATVPDLATRYIVLVPWG